MSLVQILSLYIFNGRLINIYKQPGFAEEPTQEHLEWIETLKVGDLIDCVKIENNYKKMCWSYAQVVDVTTRIIKVSFVSEREKLNR